ncbi:MAG: TolC family protein [candidate division Zixibacteria bacterium]|nr:TolC family protein [candidate division Zixibacteria bacterium]
MEKILLLSINLLLFSALPLGAVELDLAQFLDLVEKNSKDLKLAGQELKYAAANKKEALSGALPHVTAGAGCNRNLSDMYMYMDMGALSGDEEAGTTKFPITRNNEYSANVVLSQTLFNGAVYSAVKAAKQYQKLSEFVYDASYLEIMTFSKKAYHQALLLKIVWEVSQASERNAYDNYIDVKKAFETGLASEFDLLQAEVRYKDIIPQTTAAERNYNIALINLKNLAGLFMDEELILNGSLDRYPELPPQTTMETILRNRPDFNALQWEEKLRATGVSAERAAYLPTLTGSLSFVFSSQSDEWRFDEKNDCWIVGLNLSVPIFTGGATKAKVQKAKIELDKTRLTIDRTRENIELETVSVRLRLEEAYKRISSAEATLKTARKAFSIAEATSPELTTQLELKDSRVVLDQATTGYYAAVYEYLDAIFDWERCVGKVTKESGF